MGIAHMLAGLCREALFGPEVHGTQPGRLFGVPQLAPDPGSPVPGVTNSVGVYTAAEDTDGTRLGRNIFWQITTGAELIPELSIGLLPILVVITS